METTIDGTNPTLGRFVKLFIIACFALLLRIYGFGFVSSQLCISSPLSIYNYS